MPSTQLVTNYDVSQIFLGDNFYNYFTYTNGSGGSLTIVPCTAIGRVLSNAKVNPTLSTATDGSQYPISVYAGATPITVANGATVTLYCCIGGRVNQNKVVFQNGTDLLTTPVGAATTGGGIMIDVLQRNSDILLVPSVEVTITDPNQ